MDSRGSEIDLYEKKITVEDPKRKKKVRKPKKEKSPVSQEKNNTSDLMEVF